MQSSLTSARAPEVVGAPSIQTYKHARPVVPGHAAGQSADMNAYLHKRLGCACSSGPPLREDLICI